MKNLPALFTVMLLAACSSGSSNTPAQSTPAPNTSISEDLGAGLKGIDANANGIRDDIDATIAAKYSQTSAVKKAAEQKALALQAMMEATTKEAAYLAFEKMSIASKCVYQVLPENTIENFNLINNMSKDIEAMTANTRERMVKYLESSKLVGGAYIAAPVAPFCN
jgi:hypothetical protein